MSTPLIPIAPRSSKVSSQGVPPRRRSPSKLFLLVFVLSVPFWIAGAITGLRMLPGLPVSALQLICPAVAASILVYSESGTPGVIALLKRSVDYRRIRSKVWYVPALLLVPAVTAAAYGVMRWMALPLPAPEFPVLAGLGIFVASFVGALGEELGWSGYAIDALQERWSALQAAVLLGVVWAAWHVIPLVQADRSAPWIAWWCLYTVAGRVLLTWLYDNAGKSVFAAALFHTVTNVTWQMFPNRGSHWDPEFVGLGFALAAAVVTAVWGPRTLVRSGAVRGPDPRDRSQ